MAVIRTVARITEHHAWHVHMLAETGQIKRRTAHQKPTAVDQREHQRDPDHRFRRGGLATAPLQGHLVQEQGLRGDCACMAMLWQMLPQGVLCLSSHRGHLRALIDGGPWGPMGVKRRGRGFMHSFMLDHPQSRAEQRFVVPVVSEWVKCGWPRVWYVYDFGLNGMNWAWTKSSWRLRLRFPPILMTA